MAAALNLLRFILLQQTAVRRRVEGAEGPAPPELPPLLEPDRLHELIEGALVPLKACTASLIELQKRFMGEAPSEGDAGAAQTEAFLAALRLEETLDATVGSAWELLKILRLEAAAAASSGRES